MGCGHATTHGGAIWGVGGIASDGKNPFVITGNTFSPPNWEGGEAVIRFQPGPIFSGSPADYWVPENWLTLDSFDCGSGQLRPIAGGRARRNAFASRSCTG